VPGMNEKSIFLGLGCNIAGVWGTCDRAFDASLSHLDAAGVKIISRSTNYKSPALGLGMQPDFLNCVVKIDTDLPPARLLKILKATERAAGRKNGRRWGPRPLDMDILDYRGQILNWQNGGRTRKGEELILPHPEMHKRSFVLKPLIDVAPYWRHPVLDASAHQLLTKLPPHERGLTARLEPLTLCVERGNSEK